MKNHFYTKLIRRIFSRKILGITGSNLLLLCLVIGFTAFMQSLPFLRVAWLKETGIKFSAFHDSLWHLALIEELNRSIPPQHPGLSGLPLKNYHYLTDFLLMLVYKLTGIPRINLYFHIAAPIVSILFCLGIYMLTMQLAKKHWLAVVAIIFTVFNGSFAYLIPLLLGKDTPWFANSFMLDQPFDQLTNVHTILGFAAFLLATSLLMKYLDQNNKKHAILSGLLFGLCTGIKAYAAAVAIGALIATIITELIIRKKTKVLITGIISVTIFILFTLINTTSQQPPLVWSPGWILIKMVEDSGRFYNERFSQLYYHYLEAGNKLRILQIFTQEFLIYIIGNLGVRIIALIWIVKKVINLKKIKTSEIFITCSILIGLAIPLLFVQPVSVYNTIQFSPYALILLSILLVVWASKKENKVFLLIFLFLLSFPTTIKSFIHSNREQIPMSLTEYQALKSITSLPQDSVILTPPDSQHQHLMLIPGIGGRRAYFSGGTFAILTDSAYQKRIENQIEFFSISSTANFKEGFLKDAKITHIYSDDKYRTKYLLKLESEGFMIRNIYHQDQYSIFEVI